MFCDESEDIARKAAGGVVTRQKSDIRAHASTGPYMQYEFVDCTDEIMGGTPPNEQILGRSRSSSVILDPTRPPALTTDDLAMGLFYTHYVVKGNSFADYLPTTDVATQAMHFSMKAIGLGGLAAFTRDQRMRKEARKQYFSAITATNMALQSIETAKLDSTLLTVLLLGTFESMTSSSPRSLDYWVNHINGAASLLSLRSFTELANPHTARLCIQAAAHVMVLCLVKGIALPPVILDHQNFFKQYVRTEDPVWRYQLHLARLVNFRANVKHGIVHDPTQILIECKTLDSLFSSLVPDRFQPGWSFDVVDVENYDSSDMFYSNKYHIYENEIAHQTWNGIRCMRILINEMIIDLYPKHPDLTSQEQAVESMNILKDMQVDILSSVPQSFGLATPASQRRTVSNNARIGDPQTRTTFPWVNFDNNDFNLGDTAISSSLPWIRAWGGYTIIWPLYTAGSMKGASEFSRKWTIKALRIYERQTGAQQAAFFANLLENEVRMR